MRHSQFRSSRRTKPAKTKPESWQSVRELVQRERVVLFLGAGISRDSPANLPIARELHVALVRSVVGAISPPVWQGRLRLSQLEQAISHAIPEAIYEQIRHDVGRRIVDLFAGMFRQGSPNALHRVCARLAQADRLTAIATTNFDCLLEEALTSRAETVKVISTESGFAKHRLRNTISILKLHGSIDRPRSIIATLSQVGKGLSASKRRILTHLLRQYVFVFAGWSDADIDLTPILMSGSRPFIWVHHTDGQISIQSITATDTESKRHRPRALSVRTLLDSHGGWEIRGNTLLVLRRLCDLMGVPFSHHEREVLTARIWTRELEVWVNSLNDVDRLRVLAAICAHLGFLKDAHRIYSRAFRLAKKLGDIDRCAESLTDLGIVNTRLGRWRDALGSYKQAVRLYDGKKDRAGSAKAEFDMAVVHMRMRRWRTALATYRRLLKYYRAANEREKVADGYHNLAIVHGALGNQRSAIRFLRLAALARRRHGDLQGLAETWNSIAGWYKRRKRFDTALRYNRIAADVFGSIGQSENLAYTVGQEGSILLTMGRASEAAKVLEEARRLAITVANPWLATLILRNLGEAYERSRDTVSARRCYRSARSMALRLEDAKGATRAEDALRRLASATHRPVM